jgi:hypothetical protein
LNETISKIKCLSRRSKYPSARVSARYGFRIFGKKYKKIYIGYNGAFSLSRRFLFRFAKLFPSKYSKIRKSLVFAPLWNYYDIRKAGSVCYQIFEADNPLAEANLAQVNSFIEYKQNISFSGTWMVVIEWKDMHPYPHRFRSLFTSSFRKKLDKTNTFQAVLITNGTDTFVIYTYKCGDVTWDHLYSTTTIGYNLNGIFNNHISSGIPGAIANVLGCHGVCPFFNILYPFTMKSDGR